MCILGGYVGDKDPGSLLVPPHTPSYYTALLLNRPAPSGLGLRASVFGCRV